MEEDLLEQQPESDMTLANQPALMRPRGIQTIKVTDKASYEAVRPGSSYIDPEGVRREKSWEVTGESDAEQLASYEKIPEGAKYLDPNGNELIKEKFEDIDFTAQTLFNMAVNDAERRKALERSYPGKVKQVEGKNEFYVDEGDVKRKPRGFSQSPGAFVAGMAAPTIASTGGEILGGIGGSFLSPGAGTFVGAVGGGAAGGIAGQAFNDAILQLAGVYDRSGTEEATELGLSGLFGGVGTAIGRGLAAISPSIKDTAKRALPKMASDFVGAEEEGLKTAIGLREKGVMVPPSTWMKEAPHVQNVVEVFDPAFRTQKPLLQSATEHYEKTAGGLLEDMGVKPTGSLVEPEAAVSTQKAGRAVLLKALQDSFDADLELHNKLEAAKLRTELGAHLAGSEQSGLQAAATQARQAAQKIIDTGFQDIDNDVKAAMKVAEAGSNSGDMWWAVGEKLKAVRQGITARAEKMYTQADELAGDVKPDSEGLSDLAEKFLADVPPDFANRYPSVVQKLRDLAGVKNETGEWIKEPFQPTFGQLHNIRSMMRDGADWYTLSSDVKNGTYKFFARAVDNILQDPGADPALKAAAGALNDADRFYAENMKVFNARNIKTVMDGLRAGEPADPKNLFNAIVKEGHSDLTTKVMDMVGPNLASGVRAADVQAMLDAAKSLEPGKVDGAAFAREVLERYRNNMLHAVHGQEMGDKLLRQAQNIAALNGKLDISVRPGDKAMDIIGRAVSAAAEAKAAAKDPLSALNKEMKKVVADHQRELAKLKTARRSEPLGFLYNPTVGASEAVDRILGSEDLILAAGQKFGEQSAEFNMLRQIWAQKLLQGTLEPGARLAKVSPEVQAIMFPGASLADMQTLAKEMDLLMSSRAAKDTAKSMAAVSKVEHPWSSIPLGRAAGKLVPGFDAAGRAMLGNYYKMVTGLTQNVTLMRWILKGLQGDEAARELARRELQRMMQVGGALGAGGGEALYQTPRQPQERKAR